MKKFREFMAEAKEYKPEEGHKVKIVSKHLEHAGKTGYVHQTDSAQAFAGVQNKKGKHLGYFHASDLKRLADD